MKLSLKNVNRYYGSNWALQDFSYLFFPGVYGLLGPNGAGKSTLINIITNNLRPSSGAVEYDDQDINKLGVLYREKIGYVPQQQQVFSGFTLRRFLLYIAGLKGIVKNEAETEIKKIVKGVNLEDVLDRKLSAFSGGMKQRALLAQALLGNPGIIILDEPTAGLDPNERIRFRNIVSKVAFDKIVIIATHVVSDIQFIANRIILLKEGRIKTEGTPWELCERMDGKVFDVIVKEQQVEKIEKSYKVADMIKERDDVRIRIVADAISEEYNFVKQQPNLEDVYLYMV